ncbi:uncharacterized protein VTP21DRAFT_7475 [Calcarisporiella thermophila]|uniref:uncharacterized protein n=1 Tax=Calcarisporiella thermophila TaxID=911321 RepID=UPI0037429ADC
MPAKRQPQRFELESKSPAPATGFFGSLKEELLNPGNIHDQRVLIAQSNWNSCETGADYLLCFFFFFILVGSFLVFFSMTLLLYIVCDLASASFPTPVFFFCLI